MYCSNCGIRAAEGTALCSSCGYALQVEAGSFAPAPDLSIVPPLTYAGFWRRFAAAVVDMAVVTPFLYAFQYATGRDPFESPDWSPRYWGFSIFELGMSWLYSALLESSRRQGTLGQQLLDVRVADLRGRRIGFGRASVRHFGQILSFVTLGIGYLMIAFTARRQALHDRLSGCVLVRGEVAPATIVKPAPPRPDPPPSVPDIVPGVGA